MSFRVLDKKISIVRCKPFISLLYASKKKRAYKWKRYLKEAPIPCNIGEFTVEQWQRMISSVLSNDLQKNHSFTFPHGQYLLTVIDTDEELENENPDKTLGDGSGSPEGT